MVRASIGRMELPTRVLSESPPSLPQELLTKKELARRLRVSERKIELDQTLPRIRRGRTVRFDWNEVLGFLKSREK